VSLGAALPSPLASVAEDGGVVGRIEGGLLEADEDEEYAALESEMGDIRRKRGEVTARYDARLEYLRARLKGAEMKERLLRK
jgi:hypothetical protein